MIAIAPEQITRVRAAADNMGMNENPPLVSGSSLEGEELLVALELVLAEAGALVLAEVEALEAGLAAALSSTPRLLMPLSSKPRSWARRVFVPLSSKPLSSEWAAATGAKINTANATDTTSNTDLRTVSPYFRFYDEHKDATRKAARPMQIYGYFSIVAPGGSSGGSNFRTPPCVCTACESGSGIPLGRTRRVTREVRWAR